MASDERTTFVSITELFPQQDPDECRVCGMGVRPPKQKYCSDFCKTIATNVAKLYSWNWVKKYVAARDGECVRCGEVGSGYEIDHIIPLADGGHPFDPDNLQRLCKRCHGKKGMSHRDHRDVEDHTGGVKLFGGYSTAQLTMDSFEGDFEEVALEHD